MATLTTPSVTSSSEPTAAASSSVVMTTPVVGGREYFCTLSPLCRRIIANVQVMSPLQQQQQQTELGTQQLEDCGQRDEMRHQFAEMSMGTGIYNAASPKIIEDEDPETGQTVRWRDEHAAPFSWRSSSQERIMASSAAAAATTTNTTARKQRLINGAGSFNLRQSIRRRVFKGDKHNGSGVGSLYTGGGRPRRDAATDCVFEPPSVVLGGSSGRRWLCQPPSATAGGGDSPQSDDSGRVVSIKQQLLAGIARGRRVLLSIARGGGGGDHKTASSGRRRRAGRSVSPTAPATAGAAAAVARRRAVSAAPLHRLTISAPVPADTAIKTDGAVLPPPPPVHIDLVPIRTLRSPHAPSLRSGSQLTSAACTGGGGVQSAVDEETTSPPHAQMAGRTPPPQLKKVAPPVVPPRLCSALTPSPPAPASAPAAVAVVGGGGVDCAVYANTEHQAVAATTVDDETQPSESTVSAMLAVHKQLRCVVADGRRASLKHTSAAPAVPASAFVAPLSPPEDSDDDDSGDNDGVVEPAGRVKVDARPAVAAARVVNGTAGHGGRSSLEDAAFCSVVEQPVEVGIKSGFDFLDNW